MAQVDVPADIDEERQSLSEKENKRFKTLFGRGLEDTRSEQRTVLLDKLQEYREEFRVGAEIARAQFGQRLGGLQPRGNQFAVSRTIAGYFGFDSWEGNANQTGMTAGATVAWINDGAPDHLGGTDTSFGNPLQVGDQAVHVLVGVGTYHPSPKVGSVEYRVNEEPRTAIRVKEEWTNTDIAIKWLDRAVILPEATLFEAQVFPELAGDDAPYWVGLSYIENQASRDDDPADMATDTVGSEQRIVGQG